MRYISLAFILAFAASASAKPYPTHVIKEFSPWSFSPSWYYYTPGFDPKNPTKGDPSKVPCKGPDRKAIIDNLDAYVLHMGAVKVTDTQLFMKIGAEWVPASEYNLGDDNEPERDPITGHWKLDKDTEIHVSVLRGVDNYPNGDGTYMRAMTMAISYVKYRGTDKYCYEQWRSIGRILGEDKP